MQTTNISILGLLIQKEMKTWEELEADTMISIEVPEHQNELAAP
jgi:hypothetical protein